MIITDVAWAYDRHGRPTLQLDLGGHPARIRSGQKTELTRRGIVDGLVFLASERRAQLPNPYIQGDYAPEYQGLALVGCTDDPRVFALYEEMCDAIRAGTWHVGPRSTTVAEPMGTP